jgi:pSer/pThr/pTyr-binding forkhead associated (FHA) protein
VQDLGSTNGTFIDETRITEAELKPEQILRLGNVRLALQDVAVTTVAKVPEAEPEPVAAPAAAPVDLAPACAYHRDKRAAYRCENCGGCFCVECTTVVGQGRFAATTVCPMCKGQCYALPSHAPERQRAGVFSRLTQTLKLPFSR